MRFLLTCLTLLTLFVAVPAARSAPVRTVPWGPAAPQRAALRTADLRAVRDPAGAVRFLRSNPLVLRAVLERDGRTIDVIFRNGFHILILPAGVTTTRVDSSFRPSALTRADDSPHRALVLEPFATLLGPDASASAVVTDLQRAGFSVDHLVNGAVTVEVMEHLSDYGVIDIQTHSGALGDGNDVIIATGVSDNDNPAYQTFLSEGSVRQVVVAGDTTVTPYLAIDTKFIQLHSGTFSPGSIMVVNGCSVMRATPFWTALHQKGLATLVGWDNEGLSLAEAQAARVLFNGLANGQTVADALDAVNAAGWGQNDGGQGLARIEYAGAGNATLAGALSGIAPPTAVPTSTATPTATPTSVATSTPVSRPSKVRRCPRGKHRSHGKCIKTKKKKCTRKKKSKCRKAGW